MNIVNPLNGFRISRRGSPLETSMAVVDGFSDRKLSENIMCSMIAVWCDQFRREPYPRMAGSACGSGFRPRRAPARSRVPANGDE